jgi:UDP-N-acetylglucosamine 3-dehydrogenase
MTNHVIGLIGCGRMGQVWTETVNAHAGCRLAAVYDPDAAAAARIAALARAPAVSGLEAVLSAPGVDSVLVCTPTYTHPQVVEQAAAAGKHVLCEKPMALTLAGCRRMVDACQRAGVALVVGQTLRFWGAFHQLRLRVAAGDIGQPCQAQVLRGGAVGTTAAGLERPDTPESRRWRYDTRYSGGDILEGVVHELDFARSLLGEVSWAQAVLTGHRAHHGLLSPSMLQAVLVFEAGGLATVRMGGVVGFAGGPNWVAGTEGTLTFERWDGPVWLHRPGVEVPEAFTGPPVSAYRRELDDFLGLVDAGTPPENSPLNGLRNIGLGLALYRSIETGRSFAFVEGLPLDLSEDYQYHGPSGLH